jgi:fibronectin type 3 domain-containing protein
MKKFIMAFQIIFLFLMIPMNAYSIPNVPSNVTLTSNSQTTIKVTWSGDSDADGYNIYWGISTDDLDQSDDVGSSVRQYTITGLNAGTKYYVAVSAYDENGESNRSSTKSISTQADTIIPATPEGFSVTSISSITRTSVPLKWDPNTENDLDHYKIYYGQDSGSFEKTVEADADSSTITISSLTSSTRYFFAITAVDSSDNESEKSDELVVDTLDDKFPPYVPVITAELSGLNEITVRVTDVNSGMADYAGSIIFYGTTPRAYTQSVDVEKNTTFIIDNLPDDKTWYLSALAYDVHDNESEKSEEISVKIEETQSFLGQDGDFDGGCFIQASSCKFGLSTWICMVFLILGMLLCLVQKKCIWISTFSLFIILTMIPVNGYTGESPLPKENLIGVSVGYYIPGESDFEDYYDESVFPVSAFYERCIYKFISADIEAGYFKEDGRMLTVSGGQTEIGSEISMIPVSASLKVNKEILPFIVGYIGAGPDYWYCRETTDINTSNNEIEEWVGGYHGKVGVKLYNMDKQFENTGAIIECVYTVIDKFGNNDLNIGGLTVKFGLFYQF